MSGCRDPTVGVGSICHDIVGLQGRRLRDGTSGDGSTGWVLHVLRDHVAVILVHTVVFVAIGVHVDLVEFVINLWFEELFDHLASILSGEFLSQS